MANAQQLADHRELLPVYDMLRITRADPKMTM
jgi:hypothetical protein